MHTSQCHDVTCKKTVIYKKCLVHELEKLEYLLLAHFLHYITMRNGIYFIGLITPDAKDISHPETPSCFTGGSHEITKCPRHFA